MEKKLPDYDAVYQQTYKGNSTDRKIGAGWKNEDGIFIKFDWGGGIKLKPKQANGQNTTANTYNQSKEPYNAQTINSDNKGFCEIKRIDDYSKDGKPNFRIIGLVEGEEKTFYANEYAGDFSVGDEIEFTIIKKDLVSAKNNIFSTIRFLKKSNPTTQGDPINENEEDIPF
jgi:hypothetical protein